MDDTGALGLDLSFVSRVYLMEPLADAALEQQARAGPARAAQAPGAACARACAPGGRVGGARCARRPPPTRCFL